MTTQERFAEEWGIPLEQVAKLVSHAKDAGHANEHFCNGDPHPLNKNPEDKNRNSELWGNRVDICAAEVLRIAKGYGGFDSVEFTGLFPCLKRGDKFVEIPY